MNPSRLELSPLNFLHRAAQALRIVPPWFTATGATRTGTRRALQPPGLRPARPRAAAPRPGGGPGAELAGAARELTTAFRSAAACWSPSTHGSSTQEIEFILKDCRPPLLLVDHESGELDGIDLGDIETIVIEDTGESGDPYEELLAAGSPTSPDSWLEDENEPISINYTSGTTGKPKGAIYTHRGAYLRAHRRRAGDQARLRLGSPVDAADVPLQWLVSDVGGDRGRRRARVPAQGRARRHLGSVRVRGCDPLQRRPHVHMSIVNHDSAHRLEQAVTVPTGGLAASPGGAQEDARPQPASDSSLRPDRDLRPGDGLQLAAPVGRAAISRSRPGCSRVRATPTTAPTSCAWSTTT